MKEFITAAREDFGKVDRKDAITFMHDGTEVTFYKPSSGQASIMMTMGGRNMKPQQAGYFIQLFLGLMDEQTRDYFSSRLLDGDDPFSELDSEGGLFDIFEYLMEEWSARPTKQPSDYRPARKATGRASTASTRARASTS